jgi:hypothetical protein
MNNKEIHRLKCIYGIPTIRNIKLENNNFNNNYETFLIEFRELPHIEFLVKNTIIKLPYWKHSIVCGNKNYDFVKKIFDDLNINIIKLDIDNLTTSEYSKLLMTENFWNKFTGKKLLLYQEDTYLFNGNINNFLEYDYVGASWPINQDDNSYGVGNGGFSLRDRDKMIECIKKINPNKDIILGKSTINFMKNSNNYHIPEDVFFSKSMIDFNIGNVAKRNIANKFSQETQNCESVIGGHNYWLANNGKTFVTNLILDNNYFQIVKHRGGWKHVIQNLITNKIVFDKKNIQSIKCIESRFSNWATNAKIPINEHWIGFFHYSPNLPNFIKDDLDYISNNQNVLNNLQNCKGIIVLSQNSYNHLIKNPNYKNIDIINLLHPIESIDKKFNFENFVNNRNNWNIIQLGLQDRICSTIYKITTKYNKIWLPGRENAAPQYLMNECKNLNIQINFNSVKIKRLENHNDFDSILQNNIVIIPLFGASANNSVLEIIEMNIPAFVTRLPATEEYLGKDYPLFFNNNTQIENIINDEKLLIQKLKEGHEYLSNLDKTKFSYDYFNRELFKFISS